MTDTDLLLYDQESLMSFLKGRLQPIIIILAIIWVVEIVNMGIGHRLTSYGVFPRRFEGLIGILLSPFIHAGVWHAISNTLPILILGGLTVVTGTLRFWAYTVGIILLSGTLVWLFARSTYHVGASGLVFGYFGALLARAYIERTYLTILIAFVTVALYGGLLFGILPTRSYISFEGHFFGLLAGIALAWFDNKFQKHRTQENNKFAIK